MTCSDVLRQEIAEKYLLGALGEAERDAYEEHYFGCSRCFRELETLQELRAALATTSEVDTKVPRWGWNTTFLAAAAALLLAVVGALLWLQTRGGFITDTPGASIETRGVPASPPAGATPEETTGSRARPLPQDEARWARLAAIEPLPYERRRLRSGEDAGLFDRAMEHYVNRRYAEAAPLLQRAETQDPAAAHVTLYLGSALLLSDRTDEAIGALQRLAQRESAYAEEAWFHLAKAYLLQRRLQEAERALTRVIEFHGPRADEARALLRAFSR